MIERQRASERIRERQQGLGKPIISARFDDAQIVAVGSKLYRSPHWKTFPDFLNDYIKGVLDPAWGNAEIAKPFAERHPIMQWYDTLGRYQQEFDSAPGEPLALTIKGVVVCYLGLAYSLYLIEHNVELQRRLVARLKDPRNFQGAYYELIVANVLIRAGYELTLEDENDRNSQHCEFAAVSKLTGKRYSVEAKMRGVQGLLGKTHVDGTVDANPISHLSDHLTAALKKPAPDGGRLIFIDLNAEMPSKVGEDNHPEFLARAAKALESYEARRLPEGVTAYVFVTNLAFHRQLLEPVALAALPFGLGMPDFNRPGHYRLSDLWRQEKKHAEALNICEGFRTYVNLPTTFDGSLPSETFGQSGSRPRIGETYRFENAGEAPIVGTVTTALVVESEKSAFFSVTTDDGRDLFVKQPMSDEALEDFKRHSDSYFGQPVQPAEISDTPEKMFRRLIDIFKDHPREQMLADLRAWPRYEAFAAMPDDELRAEYCEAWVGRMQQANNDKAPEQTQSDRDMNAP